MNHDTPKRREAPEGPEAQPRFFYAVCQVGAEKALKAEVLRARPGLRWAFSRPGFVTFKEVDFRGPEGRPEGLVFARLWGEVLGHSTGEAEVAALLAAVPRGAKVQAFDRDESLPGEEAEGFTRNVRVRALLDRHPEVALDLVDRSAPGDLVHDLIGVDEGRLFLGRHVHAGRETGFPGNQADLPLPAHAPSRAWLKLEEALLRFGAPPRPGLSVLEVGCAPGGATTALLDRGCQVLGVDPQHMADSVCARRDFRGARTQARYFGPEDLLDANPEWLVMDMSISPPEALAELAHVLSVLRAARGPGLALGRAFLTLKLNDWRYAEDIPAYLERLTRLGFRDLEALQLCANRREFFVHAGGFR